VPKPSEKVETAIRIAVLGNMDVGKTSLTQRYAYPDRSFKIEKIKTRGTDTVSAYISILGETISKVSIWDTAGQEKHADIVGAYVKKLDACLMVFDLTNSESLESIHRWKKALSQQSEMPVIIVGNKNDLVESRQVSSQ